MKENRKVEVEKLEVKREKAIRREGKEKERKGD